MQLSLLVSMLGVLAELSFYQMYGFSKVANALAQKSHDT